MGEFFAGSRYADKICQLFGNSITFDYSPYENAIDLVVVDADHSYDFVRPDTESAFRLLRPGGTILWDDYV